MCLAIPGKVVEIRDNDGLLMGTIDYDGTMSEVCLAYVPEIAVGQYTIVHAGFAISIIDENDAMKTYKIWNEMDQASRKEGFDIFGNPIDDPNNKK